ncbi:dienelactone hydrolase [Paraburkholderia sp. DHOC27]|nr:dienelactone hydrolase [Paraburkholderia sp. DHOC27]
MLLLAVLLLTTLQTAWATDVGFQAIAVPDGDEKPLSGGVWYPTDAVASPQPLGRASQTVALNAPIAGHDLPLVVISHGSGGWYGGHYDTALALARAGFVVAAVTHRDDSAADHTRASPLWQRPVQLKRLADYMLAVWPQHASLDASRVGVFGFSAGGFTALVAAGGVPDLSRIGPYCVAHADTEPCVAVRAEPGVMERLASVPASIWVHDERIRAAVVAAPGVGFVFTQEGLANVHVPVQLWRAQSDHVEPAPDYADAVRAALPAAPEFHVVDNADHYDFLPACSAALASAVPEICTSRPGFDRVTFHAGMNRDIVTFFERTLGK